VLGPVGVVGGVSILVAFIPQAPWVWQVVGLRLVLFNLGAIAVATAMEAGHRRAGTSSRATAAAAAAVILANAWYLAMVVLSDGRPQPPVGDPEFRLVGFVAGVAMWWADAAFGLVSLRPGGAVGLGRLARGGALALALGSVLAFAGMDRLGLVRGDLAWLFTPAAMLGIALNGIGWILLGLAVARSRSSTAAESA
jgi:hypothetical protein